MSGSRTNHTPTIEELQATLFQDYRRAITIFYKPGNIHPRMAELNRAYEAATGQGHKNLEIMSRVREIADEAEQGLIAGEDNLPEPSAPAWVPKPSAPEQKYVPDFEEQEAIHLVYAAIASEEEFLRHAEQKETAQATQFSISQLYTTHVDKITQHYTTALTMMDSDDYKYYRDGLPRSNPDRLDKPTDELEKQFRETTEALKSVRDKARITPDSEANKKMSTISGKFTDFVIRQQKIVEKGLKQSIIDRETVIKNKITALKQLEVAMGMIDADKNELERTNKLTNLLLKKITARSDLKELTDYMNELKALVIQSEAEEKRPVLEKIEELRKEADTLIHSDDYKHYYRKNVSWFLITIETTLLSRYQEDLENQNLTMLTHFITDETGFLKQWLGKDIQERKKEAEKLIAELQDLELETPEIPHETTLNNKCAAVTSREKLKTLDSYNSDLKELIDRHQAAAPKHLAYLQLKALALIGNQNELGPKIRNDLIEQLETVIAADSRKNSSKQTYQFVKNELPRLLKEKLLRKKIDDTFNLLQMHLSVEERSRYNSYHTTFSSTVEQLEEYLKKLEPFLEAKKIVWKQQNKGRDFKRQYEIDTPIVQLKQLDLTKNSSEDIQAVLTLLQQEAAEMDRFDQERERVINNFNKNQLARWKAQMQAIIAEIKEGYAIHTEAETIINRLNSTGIVIREFSAAQLEKHFENYTKTELHPLLMRAKQAQAAALLQRTGEAATDFQEKLNRLNAFITPNPNPDFYQDNIKRLDDLIGEIKQAMAAEESRLKEKVKAAERALM
ncbi:MAG TPA: hypothetical protein VLJ15_01115, partial [Gammaproteobacteria bacterium]|nr:hypothetical protein [Gammaproteobacteria bacterium]